MKYRVVTTGTFFNEGLYRALVPIGEPIDSPNAITFNTEEERLKKISDMQFHVVDEVVEDDKIGVARWLADMEEFETQENCMLLLKIAKKLQREEPFIKVKH